jgi:hypothetical protein
LIKTAVSDSAGSSSSRFNSVVLPEPRKPVINALSLPIQAPARWMRRLSSGGDGKCQQNVPGAKRAERTELTADWMIDLFAKAILRSSSTTRSAVNSARSARPAMAFSMAAAISGFLKPALVDRQNPVLATGPVCRLDFALIESDLKVIMEQLARIPTRGDLAKTALGIILCTAVFTTLFVDRVALTARAND